MAVYDFAMTKESVTSTLNHLYSTYRHRLKSIRQKSRMRSHTRPKSKPSTTLALAVAGYPLDQLDRDLIALLLANARESTANLARRLGVARTTIVARLARLEKKGSIVGYTVRLAIETTASAVQAFVGITIQPKGSRDVIRRLGSMPELRQLSPVSGEFDYLALLRAESTTRLDVLLDEIGEIEGVIKTTTSIVLAVRLDRMA